MIAGVQNPWRVVVAALALVLLALLSVVAAMTLEGFFADLSRGVMALAALGALVAGLALLQPTWLLWIVTALTLVLVGLVNYFVPGTGMLTWASYVAAGLLFVPAFAALLGGKAPLRSGAGSGLVLVCLSFFLLAVVISWSLSPPSLRVLLGAIKNWAMFAAIWAFFALYPLESRWVATWLKGLLFIALVQWAPILYQTLVVGTAKQSLGQPLSPDSVTGTFGGSPDGGGLAPVLALFLVSVSAVLFALHRRKVVSYQALTALVGVLWLLLLFMEEKIIFFYIPIALLFVYRDYLLKRPLAFLGGTAAVFTVLVLILVGYTALHWAERDKTPWQSLTYSFRIETSYQQKLEGFLTRPGVVLFWWEQHAVKDATELFFGHGLGASRTGGSILGDAAKENEPWWIDRTTLSALLWDLGVFGTVSFYALLGALILMAGALARNASLLPWQTGLAAGLQASVPLFAMSTLYRNDLPYAAPMVFLFMALIGLLWWLHRRTILNYLSGRRLAVT